MNDIAALEAFERTLRWWWLVALAVVLGGLAGWLVGRFLPPVYEAQAVYSVELNELELAHRIGIPEKDLPLLYPAKEPYFLAVQAVFYAEDTLGDLLETAAAQGISIRREEFSTRSFYLARHGQLWFATVRHADPAVAAELANTWVAAADVRLREAQSHTLSARALEAQRSAVLKCFEDLDFAAANRCAGTDFADPQAFTSYVDLLVGQAVDELDLGRKIDGALQFDFTNRADAPSRPVQYSMASLGLAGALVGLIIGAAYVQVFAGRRGTTGRA